MKNAQISSLDRLKAESSGTTEQMLVCSENNFIAADDLRTALLDLQAAHELLRQLLAVAQSPHAPLPKEF